MFLPAHFDVDMEAEDKFKPSPQRKFALRELPNGSRSGTVECPGHLPNHKEMNFDLGLSKIDLGLSKISGVKRSYPDWSFKVLNNEQSCSRNMDWQPVHQRRKTESEPCKTSANPPFLSNDILKLQSHADGRPTSKDEVPQQSMKPPIFSTFIPVPVTSVVASEHPLVGFSLGSPVDGFPVNMTVYSDIKSGIPLNSQGGKLHWKERFIRLQALLKAYDQSSQEEYIHKLRSLSAAGRSKHAVELEKRAIQLLIEEGRELSRMKALNVLGKGSPIDQMPFSVDLVQGTPTVPTTKK